MKQIRKRYNSHIAAVFLLIYLLLFTENIFHVHHYDFSSPKKYVSLNAIKHNDDPFALGTSYCFLDHVLNTINFDNFSANDILFFSSGFNFNLKPDPGHISTLKNNPQFLRAPPVSGYFLPG
jgi:hypothetical protein